MTNSNAYSNGISPNNITINITAGTNGVLYADNYNSGATYTTLDYSSDYVDRNEIIGYVLDVEHLSSLSIGKREIIMNVFSTYCNTTDTVIKTMCYNTLIEYKAFILEKALSRKTKINKILGDDE